MPPVDADRRLYNQQIAAHVLALREALVRHDENLKAFTLLSECVPYFLADDEHVNLARSEQFAMVRHVLEPDAYARTYARNEHEQPFEVQFGIPVEQADRIARVRWLIDQLTVLGAAGPFELVDLGCNDGWMLAHLADRPDLYLAGVRGCDLNPDCIARAEQRFEDRGRDKVARKVVSAFLCQSIEAFGTMASRTADATVCFEVLEHVADPYAILDAARQVTKTDGRMFFSTPNGAVENGWLPDWAKVEYKGHVRAVTTDEFTAWLEYAAVGPDADREAIGDWQITYSPDGLLLGSATRG